MPRKRDWLRFGTSKPQSSLSKSSSSTAETSSQLPLSTTFPSDSEASSSQLIVGPSSAAIIERKPPIAIEKGQNLGITILHDSEEASVDIVFVHGLTGNAYDTWLYKDKDKEVHWPNQLLSQDISDARILSYGYDADILQFLGPASNSRLSNHAENMVRHLVRMRQETETETRSVLFIAHSLGGLVVKQALRHSKHTHLRNLDQIEHYTAGIIFLGVPHCGPDLAKWLSFGAQMTSFLKRANGKIVEVLKPTNFRK